MIISSTSHHVSYRSENIPGEFTGFRYTWYMQMNINQAQKNNFTSKRPKEELMGPKAYLFIPVVLDGLRVCGFANKPSHRCILSASESRT